MKNTKFDAPTEYARFLQGVIEEVRALSVDDFDRIPHDLVVNGVIKIIDFPFLNWSEKLKKDFILIMTRHLKSKNYSIDFLKELKEQFAYELQRNEMKWGTDVFDDSNYSNIFFIIWRSENTNGVRKQMSRKVLIYIDDTIKKLEQTEPAQPINSEIDTKKYTAKHYLLAYLFECNAKGVSYPIGNKKELVRIGNERIGAGKGNRFYKVFNEIINKDLNAENNLFEIGGEYWRKAVIELSKAPELVENYLQSKQL